MRMTQRDWVHHMSSVSFERKIQFSASQDLLFTRRKYFKLPESQSDGWSNKPPDFSVKLYSVQTFSQTKQSKTNLNVAEPQLSKTRRRKGSFLPNIMRMSPKKKNAPKFITTHRPADELDSELMFVRTGKYPYGPYRNPKPHNFRPVSVGRN